MKYRMMEQLWGMVVLVQVSLPLQGTLWAADVSAYQVSKGLEFTQTGSGVPAINSANGYTFQAEVLLATNNAATNASIQPPGTVPAQALVLAASDGKLSYKHGYNTLAGLESHYLNGNYTFTIYGQNDGLKQPTLSLLGNDYPSTPHLLDFPGLQAVLANGYFFAGWEAFVGGTTNDFVQFRIEDLSGNKVFETPDLDKAGTLDGTATRALVAPGKLAPSQTYRARLQFFRAMTTDRSSYPGALGEAGYSARTTLYLATTAAGAPDVKDYEIAKQSKWIQTATHVVLQEVGQEFEFVASVQAYQTGALASANLTLAPTTNAATRNLVLQPDGKTLSFSDIAPTPGALASFYGSGNYTLVFGTPHDGNKSLTLPLPADAFPPPPRLANFSALQFVNVSQPFTITWDPWAGGGAGDFIHVRIEDHQFKKYFETPDPGHGGALDGRATSVLVPVGTLPTNQGFEIHVTFIRFNALDTTNYAGVLGQSDFQTRTKMNIQTFANGAGPPPSLSLQQQAAAQAYVLTLSTVPGLSYRIDGSSNLTNWLPLSTNQASSNVLQWLDPTPHSQFFYRALVWP